MKDKSPVLFLVFNRPETTAIVFAEIKRYRPSRLFIAADGARIYKIGEYEKCEEVRRLLTNGVDWPCEIKTLFRSKNLGCGKAVSDAVSWFFQHVEEGIILEDDCLPHPDFFTFCEELLDRHRQDTNVMHIGGSCFQEVTSSPKLSYYYSNYIHVWGWATWRRAWSTYKYDIPATRDDTFTSILKNKFPAKAEHNFWQYTFDEMSRHTIDTWDYQWSYSIYRRNGLGVTPSVNLVSNIGFGADATHTHTTDDKTSALPLQELPVIYHPGKVKVNKKADRYTFKKLFRSGNTLFNRTKFKIGQWIPPVKWGYLLIFKLFKTAFKK